MDNKTPARGRSPVYGEQHPATARPVPQHNSPADTKQDYGPCASEKRARAQTTAEWLEEYTTGIPVEPGTGKLETRGQRPPHSHYGEIQYEVHFDCHGLVSCRQIPDQDDTGSCYFLDPSAAHEDHAVTVDDTSLPASILSQQSPIRVTGQHSPENPQPGTAVLRYQEHRTTKLNTLALVFADMNADREVVCFFNIDREYQRGRKKGQSHVAGAHGRFYVSKKHKKFRKFWMATIGHAPRSWSTLHKELQPRLRGLTFIATVTLDTDGAGVQFFKGENLRVLHDVVP